MLSELMYRVRNMFKPYTFEDYVREANPQTWSELKELEHNWNRAHNDFRERY